MVSRDLLKFIENANEWMNDENHIMAIHCKGGKGRTGTIICSWLIEDGKFDNSKVRRSSSYRTLPYAFL